MNAANEVLGSADLEHARRARVVLNSVAEPGDPRMTRLVSELGPIPVLDALTRQAARGQLVGGAADRLQSCDPDRLLAEASARGITFLTPEDPQWPADLGQLAECDPLHERGGQPIGLWVRGPRPVAEIVGQLVGVVGSRSATTYGTSLAGELACGLGEAGFATVSGGAFGIDQAAHRGSLVGAGWTVAVLAGGVDRPYPQAHADLLSRIAATGLVISEAPPGAAPMRIRFLARNRLIAGLARATVVVEAARRSGALNTANWAERLSRPVLAVPGPVTSAQSAGAHHLIRDRGATLVAGVDDVLESLGPLGTPRIASERADTARTPNDALTIEERQVLDAVPVVRGASVAAIARVAGSDHPIVTKALVVLEAAGLVEWQDGRQGRLWRKATAV